MSDEVISAQRRIEAPADTIFAVLADPTSHADIDGTGWVATPLDTEPLSEPGQRFRMGMYHDDHPDKDYEMTNEVLELEAPRRIGWRPGQPDEHGVVRFGGWQWHYLLEPRDDATTDVTLTYDWSAANAWARENIDLPPFPPSHLDNSLAHLADLAAARAHGG